MILFFLNHAETIGCLRRGTFLSPNKNVPKEVGLGGGAECRTPDAKAALPLRTLSRRALSGVLCHAYAFFSPFLLLYADSLYSHSSYCFCRNCRQLTAFSGVVFSKVPKMKGFSRLAKRITWV